MRTNLGWIWRHVSEFLDKLQIVPHQSSLAPVWIKLLILPSEEKPNDSPQVSIYTAQSYFQPSVISRSFQFLCYILCSTHSGHSEDLGSGLKSLNTSQLWFKLGVFFKERKKWYFCVAEVGIWKLTNEINSGFDDSKLFIDFETNFW